MQNRFDISRVEEDKVLKTFFRDGRLLALPARAKKKLIVLDQFCRLFGRGRTYTEKEVNEKILSVYDDYVTVRRYLVDYGYFEREKDGSEYRVVAEGILPRQDMEGKSENS
jgi:hypothetical protein